MGTEEYQDYKRKPWFIHGKNKKYGREPLFYLRYIDGDQEYESESQLSTDNESEKKSSDSNISSDTDLTCDSKDSEEVNKKYKFMEKEYNTIINDVKNNLQFNNCSLECIQID